MQQMFLILLSVSRFSSPASHAQIKGMRGLSGNISFDQIGTRSNYTVDIVEVTVNSELTTVSILDRY